MTVYIVSVKQPSDRAGKSWGHPYVWKTMPIYRGHLPTDKASFHNWLLYMIGQKGYTEGTVKVIRPQSWGESAGFKMIFYGWVDRYEVICKRLSERSGDRHRPIPKQGDARQPWFWRDWNNVPPSGRFRGSTFGHPPRDRSKEEFPRLGR